MEDLQELREYLGDPIIEQECGSLENFAQNVIDWSNHVNVLALRVREHLKHTPHEQKETG